MLENNPEPQYKFSDHFEISRSHAKLVLMVFAFTLLARWVGLTGSFAVDDYAAWSKNNLEEISMYFSQGRFMQILITYTVDAFGAKIVDMYLVFGLLATFLYSVFMVSILRFVNADKMPSAAVIGVLMATHPYGAEIFTFKMALPTYCVALFFSVIVLEIIISNSSQWFAKAFASLAALGMLFSYQIFLNFFAVLVVFTWIFGKIGAANQQVADNLNMSSYRQRAITLSQVICASIFAFTVVMLVIKLLKLARVATRAQLISVDMVPERIHQIVLTLERIYFSGEPIIPEWLKFLILALIALSLMRIIKFYFANSPKGERLGGAIQFLIALIFLVPISIGIIIPFQAWWPIPRVISHVSVIIGLFLVLADFCTVTQPNRFLRFSSAAGRLVLILGFILISNQIFADQQRLNRWDRMTVQRLITRLEAEPDFNDIHFVHIDGGSWVYPAGMQTAQGDMNISALYPPYSKVGVLTSTTGYYFEIAAGEKKVRGIEYCDTAPPWPAAESTKIDGDLAIICLKR